LDYILYRSSFGGKMRFCVSIGSKFRTTLCTGGIIAAFAVGTVSFFGFDQALRSSISQNSSSISGTKITKVLGLEHDHIIASINTKQWPARKFEAATDITERPFRSFDYSS